MKQKMLYKSIFMMGTALHPVELIASKRKLRESS